MDELIFIFPVHIREPENKEMWKEAVRCIRNLYNNQIIIIIDNCNIESLGINDNDYPTINLKFETLNEFKGAGEYLSFYYLYKYKPAKKAIILHDSIFIKKNFFNDEEIKEIKDVKFLWHFDSNKHENYPLLLQLLNNLKNKEALIELYNNSTKWNGCFGIAIIISLEFLELLNDKYDFLQLLNYFNNTNNNYNYKQLRCAFERIFALLCFNELKWNVNDITKYSFIGEIHHTNLYYYNFNDYKNKIGFENNPAIIKCWNNR